jgi:hypothetical protein
MLDLQNEENCQNKFILCKILGSHIGGYEEFLSSGI